ncbi:DCC1-like thiol-disulfide oxidoreductase family protein [Corynebacterium ulcerans]|uniref:DCC1-like thiol-disulfide oxidoreductase family protein n=1 Tax=Corynebacterium ulcerans TaxID=65058 RepID=UPI0009B8731A
MRAALPLGKTKSSRVCTNEGREAVRLEFYFDRDCGFCEVSAGVLARLCPSVRIIPAAPDSSPGSSYVGKNISHSAVARVNNSWSQGANAIASILESGGSNAGLRCVGRALKNPVVAPFAGVIYRLIAINRHRLGPLIGAEACRLNY